MMIKTLVVNNGKYYTGYIAVYDKNNNPLWGKSCKIKRRSYKDALNDARHLQNDLTEGLILEHIEELQNE